MALTANRRRGSREARCRAVFRVFAAALVLLTMFGLTRVALSARITEASVHADGLRSDIRTERQEADALEVARGALSTPERLAAIAGATLDMCEPDELAYLELGESATTPDADAAASDTAKADSFTLGAMLASVVEMAAGEAEALLVGDVGLASSR
jgi:hypothetical protein